MLELTVLAIVVAAVGAWFFFKKASPTKDLDVNKDGSVNFVDIKAVADVNKDGKVDGGDAKAAVAEVADAVKEAVTEKPAKPVKARKASAKPRKTAPKAKK